MNNKYFNFIDNYSKNENFVSFNKQISLEKYKFATTRTELKCTIFITRGLPDT